MVLSSTIPPQPHPTHDFFFYNNKQLSATPKPLERLRNHKKKKKRKSLQSEDHRRPLQHTATVPGNPQTHELRTRITTITAVKTMLAHRSIVARPVTWG